MQTMFRLIALAAILCATSVQAAEVAEATIYTTRGEVPLKLEVAATPAARMQGLMDRDSVTYDGMLFLFPAPSDYSFWMKNTRIPLDMLFICKKRSVAHIEHNAKPFSKTQLGAGRDDILAVIELDGGRANRESIAVGDHVRYDLPKSVEVR